MDQDLTIHFKVLTYKKPELVKHHKLQKIIFPV